MILDHTLQGYSCPFLLQYFEPDGVVTNLLEKAFKMEHIMEATRLRLLHCMFSLFAHGQMLVAEYNNTHVDFPMESSHEEKVLTNWLLFCLVWGFSSSMSQDAREAFCAFAIQIWPQDLPSDLDGQNTTLLDYNWRVSFLFSGYLIYFAMLTSR